MTRMTFYAPKEDSFFLSKEIAKLLETENKNAKFLDMGTGSGIQAEAALKAGLKNNNILSADINPEALRQARKKEVKVIKSNLFSNIKQKFDIIAFNPPYLPAHKHDKKKDTTGGKKGDETIIRFLKQAKKHLNENGKILILISSLTPRTRINQELKRLKFKKQKLAEKKIFFETLEIWLLAKG